MFREFFGDESIYTVSEVTKIIASYIDDDPYLTDILVRGEVVDLKVRKNHVFFSLVDSDPETGKLYRISCVWFGRGSYVNFTSGEEIIVRGSVKVYGERGTYNLYVSEVRRVFTRGRKYEEILKLLRELKEAGILDRPRKNIPELPVRIGVVTSVTSAAIRDVFTSLVNKAPLSDVIVFDTRVQGEEAVKTLLEALENAKNSELDVLIITRGGGSEDDLWVFNNRDVVYAVADMPFPVISAIGHSVDWVVLDQVVDYAVHTPTAAAELIGDYQMRFIDRMHDAMREILFKLDKKIYEEKSRLTNFFKSSLQVMRNKERIYENAIESVFSEVKRFGVGKFEDILKDRFLDIMGRFDRKVYYDEYDLAVKFQNMKTKFGEVISKNDSLLNSGFSEVFKDATMVVEKKKQGLLYTFGRIFGRFRAFLDFWSNNLEHLMTYIKAVSPVRILERGFAILKKEGRVVGSVKDLVVGDELEVILKDGKVRVIVDGVFKDSGTA